MLMTRFSIHAFSIRVYHYICVNLIPSFPLISWFLLMFLVNACTCMSESHHLTIYTCAYLYTPHGLIFVLVGLLLTILNLHVQISELGACGFSRLLIRIAQWKHGSWHDHPEPFSSSPPTRLSSFHIVAREFPLYCSFLYISLYFIFHASRW